MDIRQAAHPRLRPSPTPPCCSASPATSCTRPSPLKYNDGRHWVLHYVTAREMYNIAMAAIDGKTGNPNEYRDYERPRPPVLD